MTKEMRAKISNLTQKWCMIKKSGDSVEFKDFKEFRTWLFENGWDYGKKIARKDSNGPWSKDNCTIDETPMQAEYYKMLANKWDSIVGPIRERFKEELAEIERRKPKPREFFRYEHPDLVREGIEWEGN